MNGFVADESVGDRRDNEAMFERYSARARSVIFLALGCARRRGAAYIEPGDVLHALVREDRRDLAATAELFAGGPAPMEWLGSDQPPFFPDDVAKKLLRTLEDLPNRDPAAKDTCPFRALEAGPPFSTSIAQEWDSRTIEALYLLAARQSGRNGEAPGSRLRI